MFNPELKIRFISQYTYAIEMRKVCERLFDLTAPEEEKYQADLCTFKGEKLQPIVNSLMTVSQNGSRVRLTALRDYFKWCKANNVENAIGDLQDVIISNNSRITYSMVSGPLQLQKFLNRVYAPESSDTLDNCRRCVFWMAFGGLSVEDMCNVSTKDVILEDMVISYQGKEYPIYREGMAALKKCKRLTQFIVEKSHMTARVNRAPGNALIRGIRGDVNANKIRCWVSSASRKARELGDEHTRITHYSVWLSGLFYRMYEFEQYGGEVNFLNAAIEKMAGKEYRYPDGNKSVEAKNNSRKNFYAREYLNDYYNWKDAFGL